MTLQARWLRLFVLFCVASIAVLTARWMPATAQIQSGITYPGEDSTVSGEITVRGTATTGSFLRYELYYRLAEEEDETYRLFDGGGEPVIDGALGVWDTTILLPNVYTLRLRVVKQDGNYLEYTIARVGVSQVVPPTPTPMTTFIPSTQNAPSTSSASTSSTPSQTVSSGLTVLGYGTASATPDAVDVTLFIQRNGVPLITPGDMGQIVNVIQSGGGVENLRSTPFGRTPSGQPAGEVRFRYAQPQNLSNLIGDIQNGLPDSNLRIVDVDARFRPNDCNTLEQQAFQQALSDAQQRGNALAQAQSATLGTSLAVSEIQTDDGRSGGCNGLNANPLIGSHLINDAEQVEIGVVLSVAFGVPTDDSRNTLPGEIAPTPVPNETAETNESETDESIETDQSQTSPLATPTP